MTWNISAISVADLETALGAVVLASAFPLAQWSGRLTVRIKRRWGALSAGVAVAYMFIGVLPELAEHQPTVAHSAVGAVLSAEKRIYAWALGGFIAFAGLNELQFRRGGREVQSRTNPIFWGRLLGFAAYVLLIAYLLSHREDRSHFSLALYVFAMGLHIFMLELTMAEAFEEIYGAPEQWFLTAVVFLGWAMGVMDVFPETFTSRLFAFILGGVTITSAHEELKAEEGSRFWWFVWGAAAYATILLLI